MSYVNLYFEMRIWALAIFVGIGGITILALILKRCIEKIIERREEKEKQNDK